MRMSGLSGKEQALFERTGQVLPGRCMAWKGMAVGAADRGHPAPVRGDKGTETEARPRAKQCDKLIDRAGKASGWPLFFDQPGRLVADEALDHVPAERTDMIELVRRSRGSPITRVSGTNEFSPTISRKSFSSRPRGRRAAA